MNDSNSIGRPDEQPHAREGQDEGQAEIPIPELPPRPELPEPPPVHFERPRLEPRHSPRIMEASRSMALAFSVGFSLVTPVILGVLVGMWLDNRFKTSPTWTIVLLLLGIVAGFTQMIRLLNRLQKEQERKP